MKNAILVILSLCFTAVTVLGQSSHKLLRQGNKFYDIEEFGLAEEKYRKSQLEENQSKTSFNLGNALYKQGRFEEAAEEFQKATAGSMENIEKAKVFHNLGNAQLQAQKLEEALNAYKQSVRLNPNDEETLHNLMMTQQMIKMQQQQQQQQQQSQSGESNDEEQENQDQQEQENQDQQNQEQENQDQQDSNQSQQDSTQIQQGGEFDSTRLEKQELDSLDAIKLLEIIQNEEQKVQEKLRKFNSNRKKQDKDW